MVASTATYLDSNTTDGTEPINGMYRVYSAYDSDDTTSVPISISRGMWSSTGVSKRPLYIHQGKEFDDKKKYINYINRCRSLDVILDLAIQQPSMKPNILCISHHFNYTPRKVIRFDYKQKRRNFLTRRKGRK